MAPFDNDETISYVYGEDDSELTIPYVYGEDDTDEMDDELMIELKNAQDRLMMSDFLEVDESGDVIMTDVHFP